MSTPVILVDTNVWVDAELDGANHDSARAFIVAARKKESRIGIAAHSLKDLYSLLELRLKFENRRDRKIPLQRSGKAARIAAWSVVEKVLENVEVVGSDYSDACIAVKHRSIHDDFEDDLVIAAAMRMNADLLVTSDQALLKHSPVAALSPADAIHWLEVR